MKVIWKYTLKVDEDVQEIEMPVGAQILTVALQNNRPTIWAIVEPKRTLVTRRFCIHPTGQEYEELVWFERVYLGTFQIVGSVGTLVGHVFELK